MNGERLFARVWNRRIARSNDPAASSGLALGFGIKDERVTRRQAIIPHFKRAEHIVILGKTGMGKSSLLRYLTSQDIRENRGFVYFDLHGDATPYILGLIAQAERRRNQDLSRKLIVVEPGDREYCVGLNPLSQKGSQRVFVAIAEFAQILKQRWHLDSFGARTEELLRNSLHVLSDNDMTLLELTPLLTNPAFRATCLQKVYNSEVRAYFQSRYDQASEAMQAVFRDAILNKISEFISDPHFRHIVGQHSTFDLGEVIDRGYWVILNLDKSRLGEQAATLGSLFLTKLRNALFARQQRSLFTLYCDEVQNLLAFDSGLETLFSEARKFSAAVCSVNQYLDQYPPQMRSAVMAVGTHVLFQLAGADADKVAAALGGSRKLRDLLKNLPQRHMVVRSGHHPWYEAKVPPVPEPTIDYSDLYDRSRQRWARRRSEIEKEIKQRHVGLSQTNHEVLHDWE